ncbi:hypothetical protein Tco_1048597 [Tanacetum coccineum]
MNKMPFKQDKNKEQGKAKAVKKSYLQRHTGSTGFEERGPQHLGEDYEHLLKFYACKDAKSLWEAIKNRFGGNKESKKNDTNHALVSLSESEILRPIGKSSSSSNSQNVAFVSSDNSSSTNETVNIAHSVSAARMIVDDLEEMDLKCFQAEEGITNFLYWPIHPKVFIKFISSDSEVINGLESLES